MKLKELLQVKLENIEFLHDEEETDCASVVELSLETLTEEGKKEFASVLNADVISIDGKYIALGNVKAQDVQDFTLCLSGDCSEKQYDKWFKEV